MRCARPSPGVGSAGTDQIDHGAVARAAPELNQTSVLEVVEGTGGCVRRQTEGLEHRPGEVQARLAHRRGPVDEGDCDMEGMARELSCGG